MSGKQFWWKTAGISLAAFGLLELVTGYPTLLAAVVTLGMSVISFVVVVYHRRRTDA
jgi:Flp pilus assembly protein TadB